jgi:hypothetical protein
MNVCRLNMSHGTFEVRILVDSFSISNIDYRRTTTLSKLFVSSLDSVMALSVVSCAMSLARFVWVV